MKQTKKNFSSSQLSLLIKYSLCSEQKKYFFFVSFLFSLYFILTESTFLAERQNFCFFHILPSFIFIWMYCAMNENQKISFPLSFFPIFNVKWNGIKKTFSLPRHMRFSNANIMMRSDLVEKNGMKKNLLKW